MQFNKENPLSTEEFKKLVTLSNTIKKEQIDEINNIEKYIAVLPKEEDLCDKIAELFKLEQQQHIHENNIKD